MNRFETYRAGHTYVITRRFLNKITGKMRVRVAVYRGIMVKADAKVLDQFKDFDDMHAGDACFGKQVRWARSL
jgi:hypothetical protein